MVRSSMSPRGRTTRRGFLRTAASALGAAAAAPYVAPSSSLGRGGHVAPSDRITMGFIGLGTQGRGHLLGGAWTYVAGGYVAREDVEVLAVCDAWRSRREDACRRVNEHTSARGRGGRRNCVAVRDFREVLARGDIDAVLIATPIHWHGVMAILAAEAGKDIYCEKPTAVTVREGRAMVDAVRRHGCVFQAGTQQRSEYGGKFRRACELVRSGRIGRLERVYAWRAGGGVSWGRAGTPQPVPDELDWDLWLGPAPWEPYDGHCGAHKFATGNINWGQHHWDIVQWALDADRTGPVEIGFEEGHLACRYAGGVVVHGCPYPGEPVGGSGGACFVGTEGRIAVDRERLVAHPPSVLLGPPAPSDVRLPRNDGHSDDFLRCVRTRRRTICDVRTAHRAASVMLLGGIAQRLRRPLKWDPRRERFVNDEEADRLLGMAKRPPWRV